MTLTTQTARRLKELKEYANAGDEYFVEEYLVEEIINFKNELKEIMSDTSIKPNKYKLRDIRQLIKEIESVENGKTRN